MKIHCIIAAAAVLAFASGRLGAQERKISRRNLPPAVARTVAEQSRGATIRGYSEEKENGQTFYEVELRTNGHNKDVLIDASGNVVEIEEQVNLADLPAAVREGLTAAAGKGRVTGVESITKNGQVVAYEGRVTTRGKRSEVKVGPDGKPLTGEP